MYNFSNIGTLCVILKLYPIATYDAWLLLMSILDPSFVGAPLSWNPDKQHAPPPHTHTHFQIASAPMCLIHTAVIMSGEVRDMKSNWCSPICH